MGLKGRLRTDNVEADGALEIGFKGLHHCGVRGEDGPTLHVPLLYDDCFADELIDLLASHLELRLIYIQFYHASKTLK